MPRAICGLLLVALLAAGCSDPEPEALPTPTSTPTTAAPSPSATASEPEPTPTPEPPPVAALTGEPAEDATVAQRPVAAVKIDNARPARPQQGLAEADIVFEELVEGGSTRFLALYHSVDPGLVGPVRSARDVDSVLLPAFSPVVGISGAAPPTLAVLRGAGLLVLEEGQAGAFARNSTRRAPYNLYTSVATLWVAGADMPAATAPWPMDAAIPPGGTPASEARLRFAPGTSATWAWDAAQQVWLRAQDGAPHLLAGDARVQADTVVVARMEARTGSGVDSAGSPTIDIAAVGEGDALVLRDGQRFPARWRKPAPVEQYQWLAPDGRPLPLDIGRTWVEMVPTSQPVEVSPPAS